MNMPFGKYRGQPLEDIPTDYLRWAAENVEGNDYLVEECENQLRMRSGEGIVRKTQDGEPKRSVNLRPKR